MPSVSSIDTTVPKIGTIVPILGTDICILLCADALFGTTRRKMLDLTLGLAGVFLAGCAGPIASAPSRDYA